MRVNDTSLAQTLTVRSFKQAQRDHLGGRWPVFPQQRAGLKSRYEGRMVLRARQFSGQNGINCESSEEPASFITEYLLHPDSV